MCAAAELVEDSIRLPDVVVFDSLLDLDAVAYLRNTAHAPLIELLEVFVNQGPKELEAFRAKYPHAFEEHGQLAASILGRCTVRCLVCLFVSVAPAHATAVCRLCSAVASKSLLHPRCKPRELLCFFPAF